MDKALGCKPFKKKLLLLANSAGYQEEASKALILVDHMESAYDALRWMPGIVSEFGFGDAAYDCVDPFWKAVESIKGAIRKQLRELKKQWNSIQVSIKEGTG